VKKGLIQDYHHKKWVEIRNATLCLQRRIRDYWRFDDDS
jgi:hypothetical protein